MTKIQGKKAQKAQNLAPGGITSWAGPSRELPQRAEGGGHRFLLEPAVAPTGPLPGSSLPTSSKSQLKPSARLCPLPPSVLGHPTYPGKQEPCEKWGGMRVGVG